jgi:hypothetical protein
MILAAVVDGTTAIVTIIVMIVIVAVLARGL